MYKTGLVRLIVERLLFFQLEYYIIKRRDEEKNYRKKKHNPIKLCAKLTAKFMTTAYKLKILKFKVDEDPLQRRIYFLTFME